MSRVVALLATLVAVLAVAGPATAAAPRTSLNAVESEVMCVSCGVPLEIADSPQADAERREIRELIAQGKTKDQIKDDLVATYGPRVLASPQDKGFGLAAYLVPIAIVLAALIAGAIVVPKWRRRRQDAGADGDGDGRAQDAGPRLTDADAQRLEEDLARYEV